MISNLITLIRYIKRFGIIKGVNFYFDSKPGKTGEAKVYVEGYGRPFFLRKGLSDFTVYDQVFFQQEYKHTVNFNPEFIIDCGANIGLTSVYFNRKYPDAKIVAVEPEASNYSMIQKNIAGISNINAIKAGIWNKNAILEITDEYNHGNWGFVCKEVDKEEEGTIRSISIKEIMDRYNKTAIDILKMDIEGAELEVFSEGYESWLPFTKVLFIELHDWMRKGCSKSLFLALSKYDFSVVPKGETLICTRND